MALVPADQAAPVPVQTKWKSVRSGLKRVSNMQGRVRPVSVLGIKMYLFSNLMVCVAKVLEKLTGPRKMLSPDFFWYQFSIVFRYAQAGTHGETLPE